MYRFPTSGLFKELCPEYTTCKLSPCIFSHRPPRPLPGVTQKAASSSSTSLKRSASASDGQLKEKTLKVSREGGSASLAVGSSRERTTSGHVLSANASPSSQRAAPSQVFNVKSVGVDTGPPRIAMTGSTHTPFGARQKLLQALYEQFLLMYSPLNDKVRARELAAIHAKEQEMTLHARSTKLTYRNSVISALARLKKRPPIVSEEDTGTLETDIQRQKSRQDREKGLISRARISRYVAPRETLSAYQYILDVPLGIGGDAPTEEGKVKKCERCPVEFIVTGNLAQSSRTSCLFHYGKMVTEVLGGIKQRVYTCCPTPNALPCQQGAHVFHDDDAVALHSRVPFIHTSALTSVREGQIDKLDVVALDCELVYTTSGMSLARLTVVGHDGEIVLDEHVRPQGIVLDTNVRFSGVKDEDLRGAIFDLSGVREALGQFIDANTIIVGTLLPPFLQHVQVSIELTIVVRLTGHGLENDLKALRLIHDVVIDTAIIFPHPRGLPWRHALRNLTREHLGQFIQGNSLRAGHSAVEDSRAALELVRFKMKQDLQRR